MTRIFFVEKYAIARDATPFEKDAQARDATLFWRRTPSSVSRNPDDERESPLHLFYQCRHVEPIIEFIFRIILGPEAARMTRSNFLVDLSMKIKQKMTHCLL